MVAPKGTEAHSKRLRLAWLKRRWRRGRKHGRLLGDGPMPMSPRDMWHKIKRDTKGRQPQEEIRILEEYLSDWPEFKGPYQNMRLKIERRIGELQKIRSVLASKTSSRDPFSVRKRGLAELALIGLPNAGKTSVFRSLTGADAGVADYPYTTLVPNVAMFPLGGFGFEVVDLPPVSDVPIDDLKYGDGLKEAALNAELLGIVIDLSSDIRQQRDTIERRLEELRVVPRYGTAEDRSARAPASSSGTDPRPGEPPGSGAAKEALIFGTRRDVVGDDGILSLEALYPEAAVFGHPFREGEASLVGETLCGFIGRIVVIARDPNSRDEPLAYAVAASATVLDLATEIHKELAAGARSARVWGDSAKFPGQEVGVDHELKPGDTVEILTR